MYLHTHSKISAARYGAAIMEEVSLPSPEIWDCYLKNIFPNMFSNTSLDFVSDMEVTDHKHFDQ